MTEDVDWSAGTFEGNRLRQHRAFHALSFREKVERVEQMNEVVAMMKRARRSNTTARHSGTDGGLESSSKDATPPSTTA